MREIEFRGRANNKWLYGYFIQALDIENKPLKNCIIENMANFDVSNGRLKQDYYEIELETLGQYTGVKDKNGTKIFEGDIVKVLTEPQNTNYATINDYGVVEYNEKTAEYVVSFCHIRFDDEDFLGNFRDGDCEVFGNIYDSPELLEGDDE